jgi:hypothetical protein
MVVAIAVTAFAGKVAAQDRPPALAPTRDITVEYDFKAVTKGGATQQGQARLSVAAGGRRIRFDGMMAAGSSYMIFDRANGRTFAVLEPKQTYLEMQSGTGLFQWDASLPNTVRKGTDTVAGMDCTVWEMGGNQKTSLACITGDGVLLRSAVNDPNSQVLATATSISHAALADSLFRPPADYQKMQPPAVAVPKTQP